jgi:rhamnose transport system permease protein
MTSATVATQPAQAGGVGRLVGALGRQRELSLVIVMVALGAFVFSQAPQFLSASNLSQVVIVAAIIAIAATGQALVVLTRNVDLSVDAMIGLVAFSVADMLRAHTLSLPLAMAYGVALGLALGMVNGAIVSLFRVPAIVATLGTMSVYRGFTFFLAGGRQVSLSDLPPEYISLARTTVVGIPLYAVLAVAIVAVSSFVLQQTRSGRQVYAVGSNPEAAAILGIRSRLVGFIVFALCGMLAGIAGVLWGARFGTINATAANGVVLQVVAAVVVGGVNIFGGSGTIYGAALGALFLGLIANALTLLHLSQFWLQAIYGAVILMAVAADAVIVRRLQRAVAGRHR